LRESRPPATSTAHGSATARKKITPFAFLPSLAAICAAAVLFNRRFDCHVTNGSCQKHFK
jgi:hypothetical protein